MAGTAVDGEDIVQDALMKALVALPNAGVLDNPEGWLFRIAHNTALDFLRRRARSNDAE
jgi:RNA polymerase sigma-70 factor, ECF subfamily